ncbi:MAG: hypothetical protein SYR96_31545 [Actinomycetota bacterium]|nr:hypothetical protein [Actinomycetota bacterium]
MVQLCRGDRSSFRILDDRTSAELVNRINALPVEPPSPACAAKAPEAPVNLVLRAAGAVVVVRLDTGPCDAAHRNKAVRYGAGDLYRYATALLEPRRGAGLRPYDARAGLSRIA